MALFDLSKKKILFISPYANRTGSYKVLFNFISFLNSRNIYEIVVHFPRISNDLDEIKRERIKCIIFEKYFLGSSIVKKILYRIIYYFRYSSLLLSYRPDVVYSNTICNFSQVIISKILGCKTIVHIHEGRKLIEKIKWKVKISNMFVDRYIVVSKYVNELLNEYTGAVGEKIYNGVELLSLPERKNIDIVNIGVIGSIHLNKGQFIAIQAIEYLIANFDMNVRLNIIGEIADRQYFQKLNGYINQYGLGSRIQFLGGLSTVKEIYENLDIVIVPSYDESFSLVKIEAMSLKKIVIASNVGGIAENIEDGENGLLFKVGDYIELADKIKIVIDDAVLRRKITENAYKTVVDLYNIGNMNNKIVSVINQIAGI